MIVGVIIAGYCHTEGDRRARGEGGGGGGGRERDEYIYVPIYTKTARKEGISA